MKKSKYMKRINIIAFVFVSILLCLGNVLEAEAQESSMVKNITIEGGTFATKFKPGKYMYSVYFDEFQQSLNVSVELNDSRFQYTVDGEDSLERDDNNVVTVKVTDPNGEYNDENYTFNIFYEAIGLSYLGADNGICSPQFDKFHSTYYVVLENNVDTFEAAEIVWNTVNEDATVEVTCAEELNEDETLPEGERTQYRLTVREKDGTSKTYYLFLYRKAAMVSALDEDALLESIVINGGSVEMQTFTKRQSYYDVYVHPSIEKLDIQAYPEDKRNIAEVIGSTIMQEDRPIYITIKVSSETSDKESYYTLRCQYDTLTYTQKFTKLEVLASIFLGLIAGGTTAVVLCNCYPGRRKRERKK